MPPSSFHHMVPSSVRNAFDVKNAIESAPRSLAAIGYCVTAEDGFKSQYDFIRFRQRDDEDEDGMNYDDATNEDEVEEDANPTTDGTNEDEVVEEGPTNEDLVDQLSDIYDTHKVVKSGSLMKFKLNVERPGCEFDGEVESGYSASYDELVDGLLKKWLDNAPQAGYGDMRVQETKVDLDVRNAHEIRRDEFKVEDALLKDITELWGKHFIPAHVRVEPYKINVYGPGGHFKPHKDTPETDLVGTFLVGLGQTSWGNDLVVADKEFCAEPLTWVAFYPDVVHEVRPVQGYRAMLAFKVYRLDSVGEQTSTDTLRHERHALLKPIVAQLEAPYGILFQRQYGISTTELSGLDGVLLECTRERVAESDGELELRLLPVLTRVDGSARIDEEGSVEGSVDVSANVYPLTDAHVDILTGSNSDEAQEKIAWLKEVANVPFFAIQSMARGGNAWMRDCRDDTEYRGNEAQSWEEDSIYLSFAMMVLPNLSRKRRASSSPDSERSAQRVCV